ncbi:MAG TPA: CDP-glycerol glycerophosphotransferase family protein [Candidatus Wallbacteria bacterium]|nr:MAG: CDP-Glycerol:Poly(glycerophosphate) glycerophosphotransferase [bacterium ADurb.Bin243]HPG57488.1 CDP-glycerol glycerophosphotransferase family protein [Candidatus Wallbacteria bacterium]
MFKALADFYKELKDCFRLFSASSAKCRKIVFYSESDIYYQYYEGIIEELLKKPDIEIAYVTSDINDSIFSGKNPRIKPFYINNLLSIAMIYFDSKAFIMTMPDLDNFHIKRSINGVHYIYAFHAIGSTHLQYRREAFDNYDAVLCVGPHQVKEIKKAEEVYGLKPKTLIECGYHRIEKIWLDHRGYAENETFSGGGRTTVMIAPTWSPDNILDSCIYKIIDALKTEPSLNVVIRPHPEYIKRFGEKVAAIRKYISDANNFSLELDMLKDENLHKADVLITDWSGIYLEYALGTCRPVLFINTPCRIDNKEYRKLEIEPMELALRPLCGSVLEPENISAVKSAIGELIENRRKYGENLNKIRGEYLFNFLNSSAAAADYILKIADGQAAE